jgi:phospholipid/cholesterol/gamma-HCH transport system substrate-binding protein
MSCLRAVTAMVGAAVLLTACSVHPNDNTLPGQVAVGDDGYTAYVTFDQVENLVSNSTVQMGDVVIGTVAKIAVRDWQARLTLRLRKDVAVPANAVFTIGQKTLLGAQYVQVDAPAKARGRLAANADIPVSQTGTYPATEQVLASASLLLNNGGLSQISTITGELNKTLDRRVPDTQSVIRRLNRLLGTLDANKEEIVATLESLDRLSTTAVAQRRTIVRALDTIGPALRTLDDERATLVDTTTRLGETSVKGSEVLTASSEAFLATLGALRPTLGELAKVAADVPDALKLLVSLPFPIMTTSNAVRGDYANLFATVDLRLPTLAKNFGVDLSLLETLAKARAADAGGAPVAGEDSASMKGATPSTGLPGATPSSQTSPSPTPTPGSGCGILKLLGVC